jgi:hypothetical protein
MDSSIIQWLRLIIGVIAFVFSLGLIIWDIVTGVNQRLKIRKINNELLYKISLPPDFVGFFRIGIPLSILIILGLLIWKEDSIMGLTLMIGFGLLGVIWVISRPRVVLIGFSDNNVTLFNSKTQIIKTVITESETKDSDTIEIEYEDTQGERITIECERTQENRKIINLVRDRLTI